MTVMDAGFILCTYLLSRTECQVVLYRTYGTVYFNARIFDRCIPRACARNVITLLRPTYRARARYVTLVCYYVPCACALNVTCTLPLRPVCSHGA